MSCSRTQHGEWGSNPRPLDPECEVLTTRPPRPRLFEYSSRFELLDDIVLVFDAFYKRSAEKQIVSKSQTDDLFDPNSSENKCLMKNYRDAFRACSK